MPAFVSYLAPNVASLRLRQHGPSTSANGACGTFGNATRAATSTKRPFISAHRGHATYCHKGPRRRYASHPQALLLFSMFGHERSENGFPWVSYGVAKAKRS